MQRFILYLILFCVGYILFKRIAKSLMGPPSSDEKDSAADADLIRDPQCGTYFLKQRGVKGVVDGKVIHFCSEECYEKYLKRRAGK
jgi:YHS domain-containing protein